MPSISQNKLAYIYSRKEDDLPSEITHIGVQSFNPTQYVHLEKLINKKNLAILAGLLMAHGLVYYAFISQPTSPPPAIQAPVVIEITKIEEPKPIEPPKPLEPKPVVEKPVEPKVAPIEPTPKPVVKKVEQAPPQVQKTVAAPAPVLTTPVNTEETVAVPVAPEPVAAPAPEPKITGAKGYIGYLNNPAPEYPEEAIERGWEGTVLMSVQVSVDGKALNVEVKKSSGKKLLDQVAVKTVKRWSFVPAKQGDQAIEGRVDVPLTFKLPN